MANNTARVQRFLAELRRFVSCGNMGGSFILSILKNGKQSRLKSG